MSLKIAGNSKASGNVSLRLSSSTPINYLNQTNFSIRESASAVWAGSEVFMSNSSGGTILDAVNPPVFTLNNGDKIYFVLSSTPSGNGAEYDATQIDVYDESTPTSVGSTYISIDPNGTTVIAEVTCGTVSVGSIRFHRNFYYFNCTVKGIYLQNPAGIYPGYNFVPDN